MLKFTDVNMILQTFRSAKTLDELQEAMVRTTRVLGFSQFAMGHHVDLSAPPDGAIRLTTYNADWISHGMERGYFAEDPVHLASTKTANGFLWRDVGDIIRLTPRHKQVLLEAIGFGLGEGFTVPVYIPGEYHGSCSFAGRSLDAVHANALHIAQLCGTFAFEAARRITRRNQQLEEVVIPDLRPRELEAMILVGRGKTDAEIGDILGISKATAHEHVEGARRAYGNAQRVYMIVRALFDGQVSFTDLLRR
jgi:LuxR family transcriptional regulator, quorum-sensing system regulator CciR